MNPLTIIGAIIIGVVVIGVVGYSVYTLTSNGEPVISESPTATSTDVVENPVLPVDESTTTVAETNPNVSNGDVSDNYVTFRTSTEPIASTTDPYKEIPVHPQFPQGDIPIDPSVPTSSLIKPPVIPEEPPEPPPGFRVDQLSPYYKKFGFSLNQDGFSISAGDIGEKKVNITGWRFKTNRGEVIVPRAVNMYHPNGLSPEEDIVLSTGDYVNGYSSLPPLGKNVRLNRCIGHLNNQYETSPGFPDYCPELLDRGEIVKLSGRCQSFLFSLGGCRKPTVDELNTVLGFEDLQCHAFFNRFDYVSCYNRYYYEPDFLINEWRVWLGNNVPLDPEHDWIRFFDRNNLLIDQYIF
ncbi:hypothetical protein HY967_04355 [Candidatus Jorgensenbacteria bacterium]|nr:hypothetical protein [Candidatus Jorgensenbacteria bacterium]